ncbi:hypothetical protein [Parafrankia sp. FMc2]|uniref:helix-turn-helix transcriptional regulator n=1 Tax=Parafrankia sp. FMc2 TaxID=3233196 RepID=UPI003B58721E
MTSLRPWTGRRPARKSSHGWAHADLAGPAERLARSISRAAAVAGAVRLGLTELGLGAADLDIATLLRWTTVPGATEAFRRLGDDDGQVVESGRHADLLAAGGRYATFRDQRSRARGRRLRSAAETDGTRTAAAVGQAPPAAPPHRPAHRPRPAHPQGRPHPDRWGKSSMSDRTRRHHGQMDTDPLMYVTEVANRLCLTPSSWRAYVADGTAPPPDDPDLERPANRRRPRWRASTVDAWREQWRPRIRSQGAQAATTSGEAGEPTSPR